jgi:putative DNA primase/helicase
VENLDSFFEPTFAEKLQAIQRQQNAKSPKKPKPVPLPLVESANQEALPVSFVSDQFTDMRLASAFAGMFRDVLRYWPETKKWLIFDGHRWTTDAPGGAFPFVREMIESLYRRAQECEYAQRADMLKAILKLEDHPRQGTILSAAQVRPELIITAAGLDRHSMLLTVGNGTIELETGELRPSRADDLLTRMSPIEYDPGAKCPLFLAFLSQIFDGNQAIIDYLQRFFGYCLTGKTGEQILLFFYGLGCNGKSVLANILGALLGDYASTAGSDLLMSRDNRGSTNDVAALRGSRLVKVSEFDDNEKLAEAQIKTLTGGDQVTCRFLYCESFTYVPTYKLLLIGNHKPKVRSTDHGIWRRIHLLNFGVTIPEGERDPYLQDKLLQELPGILAWAVQGCLNWQAKGLAAPVEILAATDEYRQSENVFAQWLDDICARGNEFLTPASDLLASFIEYSKWRSTTPKKMGQMLLGAGFVSEKSGGIIKWRGLTLPQASNNRHWTEKEAETMPF